LKFLTSVALLTCVGSFALGNDTVKVKPFEYVGKAGACGQDYPAGTRTVKAGWVAQQGLPDVGKSDHALYLAKVGPTSNCAAAGAVIDGIAGTELTAIGFDVREDGHCGAGAPRFNVSTEDGFWYLGCAAAPTAGTLTDARGKNWTRKLLDAAALAAAGVTGKVTSISIIFDEGTDQGTGSTHLDNINVNGTLYGKPADK
jgi:hypothetical protein